VQQLNAQVRKELAKPKTQQDLRQVKSLRVAGGEITCELVPPEK